MVFLRDILEMIIDRSETSLELFLGSMDESTNSTYRYPENITDLIVVFSLHILEDDYFSLFRSEQLERFLYEESHIFFSQIGSEILLTGESFSESFIHFVIESCDSFPIIFPIGINCYIVGDTVYPG